MEYSPAGVADVVLTVSEGVAGGVSEIGLTAQVGVPEGCGVTEQVSETEAELPPKSSEAMAVPPGSTAAGESPTGEVRVNCACAVDADAAINADNSRTSAMGLASRLEFTMNG
jgi:hypothetical protein